MCPAAPSRSSQCDRLRTGPRLNEGPTLRSEELAVQEMAGAQHRHLARTACHDILMTFAATLCVVGRTEAVRDGFDLFEGRTVIIEDRLRLESVRLHRES